MPAPHPAVGAQSSSAWTTAQLLAEWAAFATLLFVTRFVARGYLVPAMDQECHIGGIAVDVLAHGVRFPLLAYAPNEYDNGSFFSGLLAAVSFTLFGRSLLALKLVTHAISAAGAVAALWLLRGCLQELGLTDRRVRRLATTVLVLAIALAPIEVTALSMYAVGNHAEGSAIDTILLALFSRRLHTRSAMRTAAFWALVGLALYLNKGTFLVIPVLAAAEIALAWRARRRLVAAFAGFVAGTLPELLVIAQRQGLGWATMASKVERTSPAFPRAFIDDLLTLGEYRVELLAVWAVALVFGSMVLVRSWTRSERRPVTLGIVVGVTWLHLAVLTIVAAGGFDAYAIYGYPTLVVLFALLAASACAHAATRWGAGAAPGLMTAAVALTLLIYRPSALSWGFGTVGALWRNHDGAACSWRFAEGFAREHQHGLAPPGRSRGEHALERCRSLSEPTQILDCVGGIARELHWRQGGKISGEPPANLSPDERLAFAYHYGTHRKGDVRVCRDFASPDLSAACTAAVQLECLVFADQYAHLLSVQGLGRPRCDIPEPPIDSYWAQMRLNLLARPMAPAPARTSRGGEGEMRACQPVFDACL